MSQYVPVRHAYLRNDIRNILAAVHLASTSGRQGTNDLYSVAYAQGFEDALLSVAVALGLAPEASASVEAAGPHHAGLATG